MATAKAPGLVITDSQMIDSRGPQQLVIGMIDSCLLFGDHDCYYNKSTDWRCSKENSTQPRSLTPLAICTGTSGLHSQSATQLPSVAFTSLSRWFVRIAPRSDCHQSLLISSVITVNIHCLFLHGWCSIFNRQRKAMDWDCDCALSGRDKGAAPSAISVPVPAQFML